jgi:hypothetical protein
MLKRNYTNAFGLKPPNAEENDEENGEETDEDCHISDEDEGTVKEMGVLTHKFSLVPNLDPESQWVAEKKLKFPGDVEMLITISAKQTKKDPRTGKPMAACVGSHYPGGEWTGAKGDTHLINARIIEGKQNAPKEGWSIKADMWATKVDGVADLLRTFTLTDGDLEEDFQVNKYFTATPQDLKANEDSTRFRFTFSVTCELADLREAAWVSLKSKESP